MSFLRNCCDFGLPVPLYFALYVFVKKLSGPQKAPHWVRALLTSNNNNDNNNIVIIIMIIIII